MASIASSSAAAAPNSPLNHYIESFDDLYRLNQLLTSFHFIRTLDSDQLPSQACSQGSNTSILALADIEQEVASSELNHQDTEPSSVNQDISRECSGEQLSQLLKMAINQGYFAFEVQQSNAAHKDIVLAVDFNFYGTRMVTASSDHKLKVFDRKDDNWTLIDTWSAHSAEITDVKWNGPFMGEVLGSVGEDGTFRLWQENATEIPQGGRRFSCIYEIKSSTNVPFMSLDFKNINRETWVALATRDGFLTVLEPVDHENLTNWQSIHADYLITIPDREDESSFKVAFHKEKLPSWTAIRAGLDRKALSLAFAAMNTVIILRAVKDANSSYRFYQAAELTGARALVRDVAWANGSMRGWDVIATASKDGCVRVYELRPEGSGAGAESLPTSNLPEIKEPTSDQIRGGRNAPSGIGAGLASGSNTKGPVREAGDSPGSIKETATMTEELNLHQGAMWRVAFSQGGEVLVATGDDGAVTTWKRAMSGRWLEYAEVNVTND